MITLRGVIEHMQDHQPLIDLLARALRPQGLLFISATPDFSSPCAALYREQWNQIACPEHIHQFTPASLSYLLARAGLVLRALHHHAAAVVLAHNHPSGSVQPSRADEALTQTLKAALALVDVRVLDHVIVAPGQALSMAEKGLV